MDVLNEVAATPEVGLFVVLQKYPLGFVLCIVALVSLCAFFITSANSGVYVLSMLTTDGEINPPNSKKTSLGNDPVGDGGRSSDGRGIKTAPDNLIGCGISVYSDHVCGVCGIYKSN